MNKLLLIVSSVGSILICDFFICWVFKSCSNVTSKALTPSLVERIVLAQLTDDSELKTVFHIPVR